MGIFVCFIIYFLNQTRNSVSVSDFHNSFFANAQISYTAYFRLELCYCHRIVLINSVLKKSQWNIWDFLLALCLRLHTFTTSASNYLYLYAGKVKRIKFETPLHCANFSNFNNSFRKRRPILRTLNLSFRWDTSTINLIMQCQFSSTPTCFHFTLYMYFNILSPYILLHVRTRVCFFIITRIYNSYNFKFLQIWYLIQFYLLSITATALRWAGNCPSTGGP